MHGGIMEQGGDNQEPDQKLDQRDEDKLIFRFNQHLKGKPMPSSDGTMAWEFMYNLQEVRELI